MQNNRLLWKVCGMREPGNIRQVAMLRPDFMGFIFYPGSPRYVGDEFSAGHLENLGGIKKTGVFVNQSNNEILMKVKKYSLDFVQLHGDESKEQVAELSGEVNVIKVIAGNRSIDVEALKLYEPFIHYWLIDSRTKNQHGGTGQTFDWNILQTLPLEKDIILSGGIGVKEVRKVYDLADQRIKGIDVNSRAEHSPGVKNIELLKKIYDELPG
jgi:phosphoribosylanthranilate isomerase